MPLQRTCIHVWSLATLQLLVTPAIGHLTDVQFYEIEGITEPYLEIEIAAAEMGILKSIEVTEGDTVNKGEVVAFLDDSVLQAALAIAQSAKDSRGRRLSAEVEVELRAKTLAKLRDLRDRNHATLQELERAELQLRSAESSLLTVMEEQDIRELECEKIRSQIRQRQITSPIDGIVTRVFRDQGEFVSLSDPVIMKIVQLESLLVMFSVPAEACSRIATGQTIPVKFALTNDIVLGEIELISPIVDPQSGTRRVRVRLPNRDKTLPSGTSCRLVLE